jgi:hypothetical protein
MIIAKIFARFKCTILLGEDNEEEIELGSLIEWRNVREIQSSGELILFIRSSVFNFNSAVDCRRCHVLLTRVLESHNASTIAKTSLMFDTLTEKKDWEGFYKALLRLKLCANSAVDPFRLSIITVLIMHITLVKINLELYFIAPIEILIHKTS